MLMPHLKPLLAASTPLAKERRRSPSTLAAYWVFGLTSFSNDSEDKNSARLYHLNLLDGMFEASPTLLCANAFSEHLKAYLSILEFS